MYDVVVKRSRSLSHLLMSSSAVKHALKVITISSFLTDLACTKFVFSRGGGSAPVHAGGAYSATPTPVLLPGFKGTLLLREGGGKRRERRDFDFAAYKAEH